MRVLFLGNNRTAVGVLRYLKKREVTLAGLVLHPPQKRKCGVEMLEIAELPEHLVFDGQRLRDPEVLEAIRSLKCDIAISILFDYIIRPEFLEIFPKGVINMHPSLVPWNRGQYPNVWSIVEGTPAGVTIHYIDEGVDTGDIILQREVGVEWTDTGETLYRKLEKTMADCFETAWPLIEAGQAPRLTQVAGTGTYHRTKDVETIDAIDPLQTYTAEKLINIIRARTFPPYKGAYLALPDGSRIYLRLELYREETEEP